MLRSIKSAQRQVRMLSFVANAAGTSLSGLDALQVSMTDTGTGVKTITLDKAFADSSYTVIVTPATSASIAQVSVSSSSVFVINTFDATDGTTAKDAICHVLVIGSDITDRY